MFDISSWEILVVAGIALIVVGPDKFAGLIRNAGKWVGKARRIAATVKEEIKNEVDKAEELKKLAEDQKELAELHDTVNQVKESIPIDADVRDAASSTSDSSKSSSSS